MENFEKLYSKVKGIVRKAEKGYYVKGWEKEDWDQEGMLKLYELIKAEPELLRDLPKLYIYFKVKFRNYINDVVRKQESQKRRFDRMPHEDIHELSHMIKSPGLLSDDYILLRSRLSEFRESLTREERMNYQKLISGQSFQGRAKMLKRLEVHLSDFRPY